MARRRRLLARINPIAGLVVIGALIAFTYVSYNANSGLPFQQTYNVFAQLPSADRLIKTDEVRIAGIRVGQVTAVSAALHKNGAAPYATVQMALSPSTKLPIDTHVEVQAASILGQTYVDLTPGTSRTTIPNGGTIPLHNASGTVELTDLLGIFNQQTRDSIRRTLDGYGEALLGRGTAVNSSIVGIASLLPPLTHVAALLAEPSTELSGFLHGLEILSAALAPVSQPLSELVVHGATTLGALQRAHLALAGAIDDAPAAETNATSALSALAQPLRALSRLVDRLHQVGPRLPNLLHQINSTLSAGTRPLAQLPAFSGALRAALARLGALSAAPSTGQSLQLLNTAVSSAEPLLATLTPAQVDCNVIGIWGPNFASTFGAIGIGEGPSMANIGLTTLGADEEELQHAAPSPNIAINYQPTENASQCQSGNEQYNGTQQLSSPPATEGKSVPNTSPPAGVLQLAKNAGLLNSPPGTPR